MNHDTEMRADMFFGVSLWAAAVDAIGSPEFYFRLLEAAHGLSGVEHLSAYTFNAELEAENRAFESIGSKQVTIDSTQLYLRAGLHRQDPARAKMRNPEGDESAPVVFCLRAEDIPDPDYRKRIYERFDLSDRISLIGRCQERWEAVHFYKHGRSGGLSESDIDNVTESAGLIFAAYRKHLEVCRHGRAEAGPPLPSREFLQDLLGELAPELSLREREVCALALRGLTGEATALELGIAETTVATLRRRAYAKLGITALNELFALCLQAVAKRGAGIRKSA